MVIHNSLSSLTVVVGLTARLAHVGGVVAVATVPHTVAVFGGVDLAALVEGRVILAHEGDALWMENI
jgi:hypothetical protein